MGMSAAYVPCTATAVKWFRHRRGLAVGLTGSGASLGIADMPPLSEALIARFGWRQTYLLYGLVVLILQRPKLFHAYWKAIYVYVISFA
jgi:MFS family permease